MWLNRKEISTAKLKDLQSLLDLTPRECRDIYTQLIKIPSLEDNVDGYSREPDYEEEGEKWK